MYIKQTIIFFELEKDSLQVDFSINYPHEKN